MNEPARLDTDTLRLDPTNPRLAGEHYSIDDQAEILEWLWREKSVNELVDSILSSGFWQHEELFAVEEDGHLVVVEGNRRLAAVRVISDPSLRDRLRISLPEEPSAELLENLAALPVIVGSREELWEFVGFKHVNGAQAWDSIAKAEYVYRVHHELGVPLERITRTIGDRHDTVMRLYRGYVVLRQAEEQLDFDIEDSTNRRFPFSHLWTALGYSGIQDFLGGESRALENANPVPEEKLSDLQQLMLWLFGSRSDEVEPKVKRQNPDLRRLVEALDSQRGRDMLRADLPLATAVEASRGDANLFRERLTQAEHYLREAKRFVATGFSGEADLLEKAVHAASIAVSLRKEMMAAMEDDETDEADA